MVWDEDRLVLHMARANEHWKVIEPGAPALAVVTGPEAYVSPAWYPSKAEHGRVVPTWNYSAVQFTGRVQVHTEPEWLLDAVTRLTEAHEAAAGATPGPSSTPRRSYVEKQLRAIVGIEFAIEQVGGQGQARVRTRTTPTSRGSSPGCAARARAGEHAVADTMAGLRPPAALPADSPA